MTLAPAVIVDRLLVRGQFENAALEQCFNNVKRLQTSYIIEHWKMSNLVCIQ